MRQLFKGGNYSKEETIVLSQFLMPQSISIYVFIAQKHWNWQQLCLFSTKTSYFLVISFKNIYFNESNDAISLVKSNMISELKEKTAKVRKLFKGGNYSREETINH